MTEPCLFCEEEIRNGDMGRHLLTRHADDEVLGTTLSQRAPNGGIVHVCWCGLILRHVLPKSLHSPLPVDYWIALSSHLGHHGGLAKHVLDIAFAHLLDINHQRPKGTP